jgi:hypothetical protein
VLIGRTSSAKKSATSEADQKVRESREQWPDEA